MVMDVYWTHGGDHFTVYTNTELLHCTPEADVTPMVPHFLKSFNCILYVLEGK